VKQAVLAAKSVAYSSGPSGFYLANLFQNMGITDQIKGRVKQPPSGVQVGQLLARGEADLGFQQISELQHVKGIDYLGPLPAEIQEITVYSAGLHSASKVPEAGKALMQFLSGPKAGTIIKKIGMEPA
jgi:molybdate transport system substrate-binding protein